MSTSPHCFLRFAISSGSGGSIARWQLERGARADAGVGGSHIHRTDKSWRLAALIALPVDL